MVSLLAVSCEKEGTRISEKNNVAPAKTYHISVSAEKVFGQDPDDPDSKVTYDPATNTLALEADDKLQVMFCRWVDDTHAAVYHKRVVLDQVGTSGMFEGTIDFSNPEDAATPFELEDIRGFVLVKSENEDWDMRRCSIDGVVNMCICIKAQPDQTQSAAGVFNSGTQFAFYSGKLSTVTVEQVGDEINIRNVKLSCSTAIWEYHVYADAPAGDATDYAAEKIISVEPLLDPAATGLYRLTATMFWNETSATARRGYTAATLNSTVSLTSPAAIPASKDNAAVIWQGVAPNGSGNKTLEVIRIITDKALYYKTLNGRTLGHGRGKVYPININLATCDRYSLEKAVEYSVDGGSNWVETLPTDVTTYSSLTVRSVNLTVNHLTEIDAWIRNQNSAVDLDLSDCMYEDLTFPRVFGTDGDTAANPANTKLGSILLPGNVTALAQFAFRQCTALKSANMENLVKLGGSTFRGCTSLLVANLANCETVGTYDFSAANALTTVNAPKLTALGNYAFFRTMALAEADFPEVKTVGTYAFALDSKDDATVLTTVNLPKATSIGNYAFSYCDKLENIYIPEVTSLGTYVFQDCSSLPTISFPKIVTIGANCFENCTSLDHIFIPASCTQTGNWTFKGCYGITEATVNATIASAPSNSSTVNNRLFAEAENSTVDSPAMTVTFGPDVAFTSARCCQWNLRVTKAVFEGSTYIGYGFFGGAANLKTIEFKGAAKAGSGTLTYNKTSAPVATGGTIYISKDAQVSDFSDIAPFKALVNTYNWTIVQSTEW